MSAVTAAAAADRLMEATADQVRAFTEWYPEAASPLIASHVSAATAKGQFEEIARDYAVTGAVVDQLDRIPSHHKVNLQFTAQDAGSVALWRKWRYVYDIDPDLLTELGESADDDTVIPDGLFARLPHPNPFIAFPNPVTLPLDSYRPEDEPGGMQRIEGMLLTGRSAFTGVMAGRGLSGGSVQRSTDDQDAAALGVLISATVWNANGTPRMLAQGVPDMILTRVTLPFGGRVGDIIAEVLRHFTPNAQIGQVDEIVPIMVRQAIATLIYLCSVNAEIRPLAMPINKRMAKAAGRSRPLRVIEVGYQVGSALRAYARRANPKMPYEHSGRVVRPHLRRAHFHTFRVGPGRPNERTETVVKWISPIPINATDDPADKTTVIGVRR